VLARRHALSAPWIQVTSSDGKLRVMCAQLISQWNSPALLAIADGVVEAGRGHRSLPSPSARAGIGQSPETEKSNFETLVLRFESQDPEPESLDRRCETNAMNSETWDSKFETSEWIFETFNSSSRGLWLIDRKQWESLAAST
jgi:hypothetical protein